MYRNRLNEVVLNLKKEGRTPYDIVMAINTAEQEFKDAHHGDENERRRGLYVSFRI